MAVFRSFVMCFEHAVGQLSMLIPAVAALSCYKRHKEKKCGLRTKSSTRVSVVGDLKSV